MAFNSYFNHKRLHVTSKYNKNTHEKDISPEYL